MPSPDLTTERPPASAAQERSLDFDVTSETAPLRRVIVHTPGEEVELVSPANREELLFEDILFTGAARREHLLMCSLFEKTSTPGEETVLELQRLLLETFQDEDARADFVERLCRTLPTTNLQAVEQDLRKLPPRALLAFALTGETRLPVTMPPLPNLLFTRDLGAVVHDQIILGHAATVARSRESLLIGTVLRHHPAFAGARDRLIELPPGVTFEGGDLLAPSPEVVLIGHSERTSFGGVMAAAHVLFERTPVEHVLAVELPKRRSCMHLDTVLTFAAPDECVVFPPLLERAGFGYVVHVTPSGTEGRFTTDMRPDLRSVLQEVLERDLTFIPCGGSEHLHQQREQWTDGANLFAIAPGLVVGYERNRRTFEELRRHGYRIASAESFLSYYEESAFTPGDEKIALKLAGTELSRGRGGPRCMTLPLARASGTTADGEQ